jgi:hypothetical protein
VNGRSWARGGAILALSVGMLSGWSSCEDAPDPALVATVGDLVSSSRSAELGLTLDEDDRILPGTLATLLSDMAQEMAASITTLELTVTSDEADERYRAAALVSARTALESLTLAQQGDTSTALDQLQVQATALAKLEDAG